MEYSNDEVVDAFLDHVRHLQIAHHVRGRIRIKAKWSKLKDLAAVEQQDIEELVARIPGVQGFRVNRKALSVVIDYDPSLLPFDLWEEIGTLHKYPLQREPVRAKLLALLDQQK